MADEILRSTIRDVVKDRYYVNGIGATSVREISNAAGVSPRRVHALFPTEESLVVAYLDDRHSLDLVILERLERERSGPREILEGALGGIVSDLISPGFRGCAFINASAEVGHQYPEVRRRVHAHRDWYASAVVRLLRNAGHPRPADAADDLMLARDGGMSSIHGGNVIAAVGAMERAIQRTFDEIR